MSSFCYVNYIFVKITKENKNICEKDRNIYQDLPTNKQMCYNMGAKLCAKAQEFFMKEG